VQREFRFFSCGAAVIIIPAIDLLGGKCVRLAQGDFQRVTVYSESPPDVAATWREKGAERIHVVDLDGSRAGSPRNEAVIRDIVKRAGVPIEVGGGIRACETVAAYLDMGVRWVILGTAALQDPGFVREAAHRWPGHIILGIDAQNGRVAVRGWTETSSSTALEVARLYEGIDLDAIVYTDISRDGMETGINLEATKILAEAVTIPVIASGGVAGIGDVERLLAIAPAGIMGLIVGRALYTGAISLEEAVRLTRGAESARRGHPGLGKLAGEGGKGG
jgi:phosphoribosylformimino-5-aminoimidazole carboxamide ribotide isomerase